MHRRLPSLPAYTLVAAAPLAAAACAGAPSSSSVAQPVERPECEPSELSREVGPEVAPEVRVMSFNLRFDTDEDGEHAWPHRRGRVASVIRFHEPAVVGVQEALPHQLEQLDEDLPGYAWFGEGRQGGETGESSAILYRTDRLELVEHDTFWLSDAPDEVSIGWDARHERVVTWGRLRDRETGAVLVHLNTHFDHIGETARLESAKLLSKRAEELSEGAAVVITGDFNAEPDSEPYAVMTASFSDARDLAETGHHGPDGTFSSFVAHGEPLKRIDYIFIEGGVRVLRHAALAEVWQGRYASDHLPLVADVILPPAP